MTKTSSDKANHLRLQRWVQQKCWPQLPELLMAKLPALFDAGGGEVEDLTAIQWLEEAGWFAGIEDLPANLLLFTKSFCVRRAWFTLQPTLLSQGWSIDVGLIRVQLRPSYSPVQSLPAADSSLAKIYDDLGCLANMTEDHVEEQIRSFWATYAAYQQGGEAYTCLGAAPSDDWSIVVRKYRQLASKHHPDKGGDPERFRAVQMAFEQLRRLRGSP